MRTITALLFLVLPVFPQMIQGVVGGNQPVATSSYPVSVYLDFESGSNGDAITTTNINSKGSGCTWYTDGFGSHQTISTTAPSSLPGTVLAGGVDYPGSTSTRSYKFDPGVDTTSQLIKCVLGTSRAKASYGFQYRTTATSTEALSILGGYSSSGGDYSVTHWINQAIRITNPGTTIPISTNTTYWVTGLYDSAGTHRLYVFDQSTWTLIGESSAAGGFAGGGNTDQFNLGRNGADSVAGNGVWYFENVILDVSGTGTFPLIPHAITAAAPTYNQTTGSYSNYVSVTISDIVPGATIKYCVDSAGTCTPTTTYSAPVVVNSVGTNHLRSLASLSGWTDSSVADVSYTIIASANPSYVQSASQQTTVSATNAKAFTSNVGAGHYVAVVVCSFGNNPTISSIADSQGNTYTLHDTDATGSGGAAKCTQATAPIGSSGALTVTATYSAAPTVINMAMSEIANTSGVDQHRTQYQVGPGSGTDVVSSGSSTTTTDNQLIFGWTMAGSSSSNTVSAGTGYTSRQSITANQIQMMTEDKILATAGATSATFTMTNGGGIYIMSGLMTLKP